MALASKAGVSNATVNHIETSQRIPAVGTVARLAAALGISAGWLAYGLGDMQSDCAGLAMEGMGSRLQLTRQSRCLTRAALARSAELTAPSVAQIENGGQAGVDTIERLAKALRVSPSWVAYGVGPEVLPSRRGVRASSRPEPLDSRDR